VHHGVRAGSGHFPLFFRADCDDLRKGRKIAQLVELFHERDRGTAADRVLIGDDIVGLANNLVERRDRFDDRI